MRLIDLTLPVKNSSLFSRSIVDVDLQLQLDNVLFKKTQLTLYWLNALCANDIQND